MIRMVWATAMVALARRLDARDEGAGQGQEAEAVDRRTDPATPRRASGTARLWSIRRQRRQFLAGPGELNDRVNLYIRQRTTPGIRSPTGPSTPMASGPSSITAISSSSSTPISSIPIPASFADLLKPEYVDSVSISDPRGAAQGNFTVFAAAFANGGDESNVQPGLDYFKSAGRGRQSARRRLPIWPNSRRGRRSSASSGITWPSNIAINSKGQVNLEIVVPEDASIAGPYASIINKWAPHPNAARLMRNYILSPEGQVLYAKGYATPILPDVEIPEDVAAKRPPAGGIRERAHHQGLEPGLHRLPADRR